MRSAVGVARFAEFLLAFLGIFIFAMPSYAVNGRTTYSAKIYKPDGYPLESASVNFRFSVLDPTGSCVLYVEDYSSVNMIGGGGLISLTLGNGVRSYPSSGTLTFAQVFDNATPMFNCQTPGAYNPTSTDNRKIVMQFNDSNGWQTLPAMAINAVPYAMYATKSQDSLTLNGKADTAFVQKNSSDIPTCAAGQMLYFNGASFSCVAVTASGTVTSVAAAAPLSSSGGSTPTISITQATSSTNGYLSSTDWTAFNNKQSATSGAIIATLGYTPLDSVNQSGVVSGAEYTKVTVDGKGRVTSGAQLTNSDVTTALGYTPANSATTVSSQWVTTGSNIYYNTGNVGIGTTSPTGKLQIIGSASTGGNGRTTIDSNNNTGMVTLSDNTGTGVIGLVNVGYNNLIGYTNVDFRFSTNNTDRMTITAGGNVGVGTTTPSQKLEVASGSVVFNANSDSGNYIYLGGSGSNSKISTGGSNDWIRLDSGFNIQLTSANINMMAPVVDLNGKLSFKPGTAPDYITDDNLTDIYYGNDYATPMTFSGRAKSATQFIFNRKIASSTGQLFSVLESGTSRFTIDSSGNVGIGATTPTATLHLKAGTAAANTAPLKFTSGTLLTSPESGTVEYDGTNLYFTDSTNMRRTLAATAGSGTYDNAATISNASGNITMYPNGGAGSVVVSATTASTSSNTGALVVKGGLGVAGSTNIAQNLNVSGSSVIDGSLKLSSMTSGSVLFAGVGGTVTQDNSNFYWDGANKRLGIGTTSPQGSLDNRGTFYTNVNYNGVFPTFNATMGTGGLAIGWNGESSTPGRTNFINFPGVGTGGFSFHLASSAGAVTSTPVVVINGSGNVGIGTASPLFPLSVSGTIQGRGIGYFTQSSPVNSLAIDATSSTLHSIYTNAPSVDLSLGTNNSTAQLYLKNNGNVGIGTSTLTGGSSNTVIDGLLQIKGNDDSTLLHLRGQNTDYSGLKVKVGPANISGGSDYYDITIRPSVGPGVATVSDQVILRANNTYSRTYADVILNPNGGNVGIGSLVASSPLHVKGNATGGETLRLSPTGGGTEGGQFTLMDAVGIGGWEIDNWGSDGQEKLRIFRDKGENNLTNAFTISASGTVGIGTSNPNTNNPLHVAGTTGAMLRLQGTSAQGNNWIVFDNNSSDLGYVGYGSSGNKGLNIMNYQNDKLSLGTSSTEIVYILPSGNVGIGTTSPLETLHIAGASSGSADQTLVQIGDPSSGSGPLYLTYNAPFISGNTYFNAGWKYGGGQGKPSSIGLSNGLTFFTADEAVGAVGTAANMTAKMTITSNGNVGIGVTAPTYQLQLSTDSAAKPGTSSWTIASDKRLKDIRAPFTRGMNELLGLNTIYFNYKKDNPLGLPSDKEYVGIKAQDVQKVIPEAISVDEQGYLHVTNDSIIWTAVNAIKELYKKFLNHDEQIAELKAENAALKAYLCDKDPAAPICK